MGQPASLLIDQAAAQRVEQWIAEAVTQGARVLLGGKRMGSVLEATVLSNVKPDMKVSSEEVFGPVLSTIRFSDLDEAIRINNEVRYGLSSSIYTRDVLASFRAMADLDNGITYVNAPTIGAEVHLPFGGTKATGNGHREAGTAALDVFSEWKSIYVDFSGRLQRAQIDTEEL